MTTLRSDHPLYKRIVQIHDQASPALYDLVITFTNPDNENLTMDLEYIDRLDQMEIFSSNFMEYFELEGKVNVVQYRQLMNNYNNLRAVVAVYYFNEKKGERDGICFKETYQALIHKVQDVSAVLPKDQLYDEKDPDKEMTSQKRGQLVELKVQLIKPDIYKFAKLRMNTILEPGSTVEDALWVFCQAIGIKSCCMCSPDNKEEYNALELKPMQGLDSVFNYLQSNYGVYNNDGCLYYHNGKLYIYPLYVTEGKSDDTFHIYKAPPGFLLGAKGTTIFEEKDTVMFTNQLVNHRVTAIKGVETANSIFSINSGNLDNWAAHDSKGSSMKRENAEIYNASLGKGSVTNTHTPVWKANGNNECAMKSELAKLNVSPLEVSWPQAIPFLIKPFQKMMFHYEKGDKIESVSCTCASVSYTYVKQTRLKRPVFSIQANMKIFIPNGTEVF